MTDKQRDIDIAISNILRAGVLLSCILCSVGGAILLAQDWGKPEHLDNFDNELKTFTGILHLAADGHPEGIIQLGVLVLLSTPILRVSFAGLAFLKERDYVYFVISLLVLGGLIYSLVFS